MHTSRNLNIRYINTTDETQKKICTFLENWSSDRLFMKVQTSGSTGTPKIIDVDKNKMIYSAQMTCDFLDLKKGNSALLCLPLDYISGQMMMVRSLVRDLEVWVTEPTLSPLAHVEQCIDFCAMTPLQVENSLDKIHIVKKLIIGGAAVSNDLKNKIANILKPHDSSHRIFETYGMSETLSHIALKEIYPKSAAYFTPLPHVKIHTDRRGCLVIHAPLLNEQVLITNDLVEINEQQQFRFLGRIDNVINTGGAKVFAESLEQDLKQFIPNELCFVGSADEVLGQKLILVIEEKNPERHAAILKIITDFPFQKSFQKPKQILFTDEIPRTGNGKVQRQELLKQIRQGLLGS